MENNGNALTLGMAELGSYIPEAALIVFRNDATAQSYLELRPIRKDGTMGAAKPVSKQFIQELLSGFSKEHRNTPHGPLPENLLYADTRTGCETYLWFNPPQKRMRFFDDKLGLENGIYHVPGTLYLVKNNKLSVWCFTGKKPQKDRPLLGVPYFNIYGDGSVCMGTAKPQIPDKADLKWEDVTKAWENAFWNSIDVHTNGSPSTKANLIETIKRYKDKAFDTKELVVRKDNLTVDSIIRKIQKD